LPSPAAAAISVSTAFASWSEAWGSLIQLLVNIAVLIVVGALALRFQRAIWRHVGLKQARSGGRA